MAHQFDTLQRPVRAELIEAGLLVPQEDRVLQPAPSGGRGLPARVDWAHELHQAEARRPRLAPEGDRAASAARRRGRTLGTRHGTAGGAV